MIDLAKCFINHRVIKIGLYQRNRSSLHNHTNEVMISADDFVISYFHQAFGSKYKMTKKKKKQKYQQPEMKIL